MMASPEVDRQRTAEYNALIAMTEDLCSALPISDHDLLPRMISNRVISLQEKTEIRNMPNDRDKVQLLISKLSEEMVSGDNERFYKFIKTMKKSPKCSFLVKRMERWIGHYRQLQLSPMRMATYHDDELDATSPVLIGTR